MEQRNNAQDNKKQNEKEYTDEPHKDRIQKDRTKNRHSQSSINVKGKGTGEGGLQLEDKILKTAAQFFGDALLPLMGIQGVARYVAPTEQIHLEARRLEEDFNFAMEDGTLRHLEFESDRIATKDLRRFREYEAYMSMVYQAPVITSVICTSDVKVLKDSLTEGLNSYRVEVLRLKDRDADILFQQMETRFYNKEPLTRKELLEILLTPLMSGVMSVKERIFRGLDVVRREPSEWQQEDRRRMETVLYALAVKLLGRDDLAQVKERFGMTILGQMLMEDGIEKGLKEGIEKGERIKLISQVLKKAKRGLRPEVIAETLEEDPEVVERICEVINKHPDLKAEELYEQITPWPPETVGC